jgi:hypothetical protein
MSKVIQRTRMEVLELWVAALRSGKYEQARGNLREGDGFCCLGVLCDLASKDGGPQWDGWSFMGSESHLPYFVAKFVNLNMSQESMLARMNDNGRSFKQIADHIEATLIRRNT